MARPKRIKTKQQLLNYLTTAADELPFNEECYKCAAVEVNKRNEQIRIENSLPGAKAKKPEFLGNVYFELLASPLFNGSTNGDTSTMPDYVDREDPSKVRTISVEDFIDDIDTAQGQFIFKFIKKYFGNISSMDTAKFIIARVRAYYGEYELNSASDEFLVMSAITDELVMRDITRRRINYKYDNNKELETIRNVYMKSLEGLKALKKFDKGEKENENKFSVWVNKLVEEGDLDVDAYDYEEDDIDRLIKLQVEGLRGAF